MNTKNNLIAICLLLISTNIVAMSYAPLPQNMANLVNTSDLIVVATIGEVLNKNNFYGYQENADVLAIKDKEIPLQLGIQIVDFAVEVTEIIQDDKNFPRLNNEDSIILRLFQTHDSLSDPVVMKERSGNMILFLTRNPDDKTYGLYSAMHKVMFNNFDEEVFYYLDSANYKLPFAENAAGFISEVKTYIKSMDLKASFSENVTGLWQDVNNEKSYYSFHQSNNTIIIIDLFNLESSGKIFSATYVGSVEDYILKPILPGLPISVEFQSNTEATMIPICEVCSVVITQLKKVF